MIQWDKTIIKTPVGYPRTERCTARTTALPFFKEPLELEAPFSAVSDPAHVAQAITFEVGVPYYMDHDGNISTTPAFYFLGVGTESGFSFTPMSVVIDSIGTLYLIGEFEDGVDYYALPNGDITTDITGIYLGVGNSDGDIDLDITVT